MAKRVIVIDHDFETYCDLDIRKVGAYKYAQHPSCEPLVLTWGETPDKLRTWIPHKHGYKLPEDLLELARDDNVVFQAHNAQFEFCIWRYVLTRKKYGAPKLPFRKFQCTAVRAAAAGLPRSLDMVGLALNLDIRKDKEGSRLLRKFAVPQPARKASKKNPDGVPARRIFPQDDPDEFKKLVQYNKTDVLVEMQVAEHTPPLSASEQRQYTLDLKMNTRGLPLDMAAVNAAMPVLTELEQRVTKRVMKITGGIRPTQRDRMLEFCKSIELPVEDLKAKTLKDLLLLQGGALTNKQIMLLRLRIEGGKASTKKLKKMLQVVCDDGRVRGGFLFYGAHTGRYAGRLIQPQNFTRGEYKPEQLERLFEAILLGDADALELLYEWPIDAIAQGMRGFIHAADGKVFYVSDFSAIEARLLAWLANETEVLEIYRKNGDVYIRMASKLYKIPEKELIHMCKVAEDPAYLLKRKFAKDIVLGCFGPETQVLTQAGPKRIIDVCSTDLVWDGIEWVPTQGPAYMGDKEVINLCGVTVTPDHQVLVGQQWHRADEVMQSTTLRQLAHDTAGLPCAATTTRQRVFSTATIACATAGLTLHLASQISITAAAARAMIALNEIRAKLASKNVASSEEFTARISSLAEWAATTPAGALAAAMNILPVVGTFGRLSAMDTHSVGIAKQSGRALPKETQNTATYTQGFATCTDDAGPATMPPTSESSFASVGGTFVDSPPTANAYPATNPDQTNWKSTESTALLTTGPATADLLPSKSTSPIRSVYDLVECGPRNRFTILTPEGPLLVHNCGYQMGGPGFYRNCIERGVLVTEDECKDAVRVYRNEHPNIVRFWYDVEDAAVRAVAQKATRDDPIKLRNLAFFVDEVKGYEWFCIRLPSGRLIRYAQPKVNKVERFGKLKAQLSYRTEYKGKWIRETTYGGKLVENIVQAVAYDVMAEAMLRADDAGFCIVGTVHDEIIAENEPYFSDNVKVLDDVLRVLPQWAQTAPINAEGFISPRYRK